MKYAEIKQKLSEPIPADLISQKEQPTRNGSVFIDYVNITDLKDILDDRAGLVWESIVQDFKQIGDLLCCVVSILIYAEDGTFRQDGTGQEPLSTTAYGDPFSNAYAQAFRRACEGHGLGRELWRKDDHHPKTNNSPQSSPPRQSEPRGQNRSQQRQFDNSKPPYGQARNTTELITVAQSTLLKRRAHENKVDLDGLIRAEFSDVQYVEDLSKKAASYLIDELGKPAEAF